MFNYINVSLDMAGCNKKCKFCRYNKQNKAALTVDDLHLIYELLSPFTNNIVISSFYKEIDVLPNYIELFEIENKLNDQINNKRLNRINVEKIANDIEYLKFIKQQNINNVIIDIYGNRHNHDYFVGRNNNFNTIINTTKILKENNIFFTWNIHLNKQNVSDLNLLSQKIKDLDLNVKYSQELPTSLGLKNISYRLTKQDLNKIPSKLNVNIGLQEKDLYTKYIKDKSKLNIDLENIELLIDSFYNVYIVLLNKKVKVGNIKKETIVDILENINNNNFIKYIKDHTFKDMVLDVGNINGNWIFSDEEYILYIIELIYNKYFIIEEVKKDASI